jgi:ribonuclease P protein component
VGPRLAVIAGRRFRTAVRRNRARRLLREACRVALREERSPWDLILVARPEVLHSGYAERAAAIAAALRESGVLGERVGRTP